jgi:tripartite-type tricarboxylate transporter receptor subunit TctC
MTERLKQLAGIDLSHVPYKGEAQFRAELINGQLDLAFCFPASCLAHIKAGTLRPIAVSSKKRFTLLPAVPTLSESGVTGYDERIWAGFAAPAGIAPERLRKLHQAFQSVLRSAEFQKYLDTIGYEAVAGTPDEAAALIKADYERYGKIVKALGLRVE